MSRRNYKSIDRGEGPYKCPSCGGRDYRGAVRVTRGKVARIKANTAGRPQFRWRGRANYDDPEYKQHIKDRLAEWKTFRSNLPKGIRVSWPIDRNNRGQAYARCDNAFHTKREQERREEQERAAQKYWDVETQRYEYIHPEPDVKVNTHLPEKELRARRKAKAIKHKQRQAKR